MAKANNKKATPTVNHPTTPEEKKKALDTAMEQIIKNYGQGSVMFLGGEGNKKLFAADSGNLVYKGGRFNIETTFQISSDVDVKTGNIDFLGDVVIKGSVQEGYTVTAGKSITVLGMVTGATLTAQGDITVKNGVFASTVQSQYGNINIAIGENDTITTRGNLTSTSLVGCRIKIEGDQHSVFDRRHTI